MSTEKTDSKKCPVCDYELDSKSKAVRVGGRKVRVCCDECGEKVAAQPNKYARNA